MVPVKAAMIAAILLSGPVTLAGSNPSSADRVGFVLDSIQKCEDRASVYESDAESKKSISICLKLIRGQARMTSKNERLVELTEKLHDNGVKNLSEKVSGFLHLRTPDETAGLLAKHGLTKKDVAAFATVLKSAREDLFRPKSGASGSYASIPAEAEEE